MVSFKRGCISLCSCWRKNRLFLTKFYVLLFIGWLLLISLFSTFLIFVDDRNPSLYTYRLVKKFFKYHLACQLTADPSSIQYRFNTSNSNPNFCHTVTTLKQLKFVLSRSSKSKSVCYNSKRGFSDRVAFGRPFGLNEIPVKIQRILMNPHSSKDGKSFIMVTAASSNHFDEFANLLETWRQYCPENQLTFVDLGLTARQLDTLKTWRYSNFAIEKFDFGSYPKFVENLFEYRWKLLLLIEFSQKFSYIVWVDSSFRFQQETCQTFIKHKNSNIDSPMTMYLDPKHSILSTTNPKMYEYFPTDLRAAQQTHMFGGGVLMLRRSPSLTLMMFWWALCALRQDCLSPKGSVIKCHWDKTDNRMVNDYSCCHRFDMSLINILLYDKFGSTNSYFSSELAFLIRREFFNY